MGKFILSVASMATLRGVHPDLVKVAVRAIELSPVDFRITCGTRTVAQQRTLVRLGKSWTMHSRHLVSGVNRKGHALDFCALIGNDVSWDFKYYAQIARAFKRASAELKIPVEWGGDWKQKDGPHIQLPVCKAYPA